MFRQALFNARLERAAISHPLGDIIRKSKTNYLEFKKAGKNQQDYNFSNLHAFRMLSTLSPFCKRVI